MARFAAFLRAINVGGTGKLPMATLRNLCVGLGFESVQTYVASGNVVFHTSLPRQSAKALLEAAVAKALDKPTTVFLREAGELESIISANPFSEAEGGRLLVIIHENPAAMMISEAKNRKDEQLALGPGCIFAHYPSGMGQSKLKIPGAEQGTARNMNTIRAVLVLMKD